MRRLSLLALALVACSEQGSSAEFTTESIHAEVTVVANGLGTSLAQVRLWGNGNELLELSGGDELVADQDGDRRTMIRRGSEVGDAWYSAEFPVDRPGARFRVALLRGDGTGATGTYVTLPERFHITGPESGRRFDIEHEPIVVTWEGPSAHTMRIEVDGDCIDPWEHEMDADVGQFRIPAETLGDAFGGPIGCDAIVRLSRVRRGRLDDQFSGGFAEAIQTRAVKIEAYD